LVDDNNDASAISAGYVECHVTPESETTISYHSLELTPDSSGLLYRELIIRDIPLPRIDSNEILSIRSKTVYAGYLYI